MRTKLFASTLMSLAAATTMIPDMAMARHHSSARRHYVHSGHSHRCSGGSGVVGTVAGGAGGAVIAHAVVGGPVATIAGGVGGALLGRHIDKQNVRHRRGC
jgi:outer membrane lipoprotein SlyB